MHNSRRKLIFWCTKVYTWCHALRWNWPKIHFFCLVVQVIEMVKFQTQNAIPCIKFHDLNAKRNSCTNIIWIDVNMFITQASCITTLSPEFTNTYIKCEYINTENIYILLYFYSNKFHCTWQHENYCHKDFFKSRINIFLNKWMNR